jgi:hypothetical protein
MRGGGSGWILIAYEWAACQTDDDFGMSRQILTHGGEVDDYNGVRGKAADLVCC